MRKTIAATLGLVLVAGAVSASNTGFKLNYDLTYAGATRSNNNWIAVPFFYYPSGTITATPQNAVDFCADLNGAAGSTAKVVQIYRFDTGNDKALVKNCANTSLKAYDIKPGEGYSAVPNPGAPTTTVDIVGSHDDTYAPNKGGTATYALTYAGPSLSNNNWISVPYHVKADNAIDLCSTMNGAPASTAKVVQIYRFDTGNDKALVKNCANTSLKAYDLKPGEGYSAVPPAGAPTQQVAYDVY